jgi:hypothetical protein
LHLGLAYLQRFVPDFKGTILGVEDFSFQCDLRLYLALVDQLLVDAMMDVVRNLDSLVLTLKTGRDGGLEMIDGLI